jgi:class 3 adenylate cyclase
MSDFERLLASLSQAYEKSDWAAAEEIALELARYARRQEAGEEGPQRELHLTILRCDFVGSTELSERLGREDYAEVIETFKGICADLVDAHDGHVHRFDGDCVVAYFGYPRPREHDARRALLASFAILRELAAHSPHIAQTHGTQLSGRIGIHSGTVLLGGRSSRGWSDEEGFGEVLNVAARVQEMSAPDEITLSAAAANLLRGAFELTSLGEHALRGVPRPVELLRARGIGDLELRHAAGALRPLAGRDQERELLSRTWSQARQRGAPVLLLAGPPGIGKSRLMRFLMQRAAASGGLVRACYCEPEGQSTAFQPLVRTLERVVSPALPKHVEGERAPAYELDIELARRALDAVQRRSSEAAAPYKRRDELLQVFTDWIVETARRAPLLFVLEDAQWADPSTLELLERIAASGEIPGLLVACTARSEADGARLALRGQQRLELAALDSAECDEMIEHLAPGCFDARIRAQIAARSEGVPLYVEAIVRSMLEASGARRDAEAALREIPRDLGELLSERLHRPEVDLELAQLASMLGREFPASLLRDLAAAAEAELRTRLDALVRAEIIEPASAVEHGRYRFTHHLIYEAAYASELESRRRLRHLEAASALEQRRATEPVLPEEIARHLTAGRAFVRAVGYWKEAGENARAQAAHLEAIRHFSEALDLLEGLEREADGLESLNLELRLARGLSYTAVEGHSSERAQQDYTICRLICEELGYTDRLVPTLWGLWSFYVLRGDHQSAGRLTARVQASARASDEAEFQVLAAVITGYQHMHTGAFRRARAALGQGMEIIDKLPPGTELKSIAPRSTQVSHAIGLANVCWIVGEHARAEELCKLAWQRALALSPLSRSYGQADALVFSAWLHQVAGDAEAALRDAELAIEIAAKHGFRDWLVAGHLHRAIARGQLEPSAATVRELAAGIELWRSAGCECFTPYFMSGLAQAQRLSGDLNGAWETLESALRVVRHTCETLHLAEIHRLRGEVLHEQKEGLGRSELLAAVDVAHAQEALSFELRARTSLARCGGDAANLEALRLLLRHFDREPPGDDVERARQVAGMHDP